MAAVNTRSKLIEAAERLFAQRSVEAVSFRQIAAAAGQRNPSVVHYHFGSKKGLIEAILQHRQRPINHRRLALIEKLERDGQKSDLRSLVEIIVYPMVENLQESPYFARFLAHVGEDPEYAPLLSDEGPAREPFRRVVAAIAKSMRGVPDAVRDHRIVTALKLVNRVLSDQERALEIQQKPAMPTTALAAELVDMIVGLITVPVSPIARRALR